MPDFFSMMGQILSGPAPSLARLEPEDNNGLGVSTVNSTDCGYETAILDKNGVHPVERYGSEEEARKGHKTWVEKTKTGLKKITKLGYGDLIGDEEIELVPDV